MLSRYLDPKNDYSFKKIFGEEKHKRIPIDFLNAVFQLTEEKKIIDLEFLNPKQPPHIAARKESIVDVMVQDQKGDKYVVEMQVAKIERFEKRAQYYAAKTYCAHYYEKLMMNEADMHGTLEAAKKEGLQEGLEGLEKGKREKTIEIATAMLTAQVPIEQISRLLGLSEKEIHSLKQLQKNK